jgi:hypothetical protein
MLYPNHRPANTSEMKSPSPIRLPQQRAQVKGDLAEGGH